MYNTCKYCVYFSRTLGDFNSLLGYGECLLKEGTPKKETACACKFYKQTPNDSEE